MKPNLSTVIGDFKSGQGPRLLLLFGDDLQVQEASQCIVDVLVPDRQRGFNLEHFDGRVVAWDQVEVALMTPPFYPGKKVVWVENAPYFLTREQKEELGEQVLELWSEGKRDDAAKLLTDMLIVEGWTQDQWDRLETGSCEPLLSLLDAEGRQARIAAEELLSYCKTKGMTLRQPRRSDGHRLAELLEEGLPEWDVLLLTALQVDRRTRLYKRFEEQAVVLDLGIGRDRSGRISRDSVLEFVQQRLRQAGKTLEPQAREMISLRAGNELRALQQEIEKLLLFVGDRSSIRASDVEMIVTDRGEGWVFDLTRAMSERDPITALGHLGRLLNQGEHPLKILGTFVGELRRLISARQLLDGKLNGLWKRGMTYPQFQQNILKEGTPLVTRNPYGDYMCFQKADHFSLNELCSYMEVIFAADLRLKSSTSHPRIVLERLVLALCLGSPRTYGPREHGAKP